MIQTCDVLVIGGGGAALRAALAAYETAPQLKIVLVTKGTLGQSGVTATACSDRMAFHATLSTTEPGGPDAWRYHADDIYRIGGQVSDADLAAVLARNGAAAFDYLDRLGVPWARRPDGTVDQFVTDGSRYARACYTGPYTANHIEGALVRRLRTLPIQVIEHQMVAELLRDATGRRVVGALLLSQAGRQLTTLYAGAVVLATGGAGQAFAVNVFPPDCTGDGYALAYRAGAELVNLEFIQIGLCSLQTGLACSGSLMRALPRLVNERDEEFLLRYFPARTDYAALYDILFAKGASWPVSSHEPSHRIDLAVARELASGRRVFLDYSHDPLGLQLEQLSGRLRAWYEESKGVELGDAEGLSSPLTRLLAINRPSVEWFAQRGVDLRAGDRIEIAPAIQHFQGGVKIRTRAETTLAGLYAAGEVAGGQHGANRPGGNALLDSQVFGRIAGENAAHYALSQRAAQNAAGDDAEAMLQALFTPSGAPAEMVRAQVQSAMARFCGVYRTEAGLQELCDMLEALARRGVSPSDAPAYAVETVNLLQTAQLIARAALRRDESRGPHLRFLPGGELTPLPQDDARWSRYIVFRAGPAGPLLEVREPVRPG